MSETIWRATDNEGDCWDWEKQPSLVGGEFFGGKKAHRYTGPNKPPPGECWEIVQTRKGDIDTDGEPIGWKIVGIGKDGSVLCEKGNGQRRRYSFVDGANGKPSGEAWEWLVAACKAYCAPRKVPSMSPLGAEIQKAYAAYESAQSTEPSDRQATIEVLTKERDEAKAELRSLSTHSGHVTTEQINVIAELRAKLERPEMPEVVRSLIGDIIREVPGRFSQAIAAVEAHYAPPFRIQGPGVYETEDGNPWEVIYIDPKGGVVARHETTKLLENFHVSGSCKGGQFSLTKYLRPLEG